MYRILPFLAVLFFAACSNSSKNSASKPNDTANTTVEPQKKVITVFVTAIKEGKALLSDGTSVPIPNYGASDAVILYCVRHAEKEKDGTDNPTLTPAGHERAGRLGRVLQGLPIKMIGSTNYKRSTQTGEGAAPFIGSPIFSTFLPQILKEWVTDLIANGAGNQYLIVGHQNTTPELANYLLGEERYPQMSDDDFGKLYVISTKGVGKTEVLELNYE